MMRTQRVRRVAAGLAVALGSATFGLAGPADAEVGPLPPPDEPPVECNGFTEEQIPLTGIINICLELRLKEGAVRFGNVESTIDDEVNIRQVMTIGGDLTPVPVEEEGAGDPSFPETQVPGGLLGALGLQGPIFDALAKVLAPINDISAAIIPVGEIEQAPPDILAFLTGEGTLTTATLPFMVQVKNLLLGSTCTIGSAADPIVLNLPIVLTGGYFKADGEPLDNVINHTGYARLDATDATFEIPAASDCGLLGTGRLLNRLGLKPLNLFDTVVNNTVGLPSASGNNLIDFDGYLAWRACDNGTIPQDPPIPSDDPRHCYFQG